MPHLSRFVRITVLSLAYSVLPAHAQGTAADEARFQALDMTQDGWLSGTELTACGCAKDDSNHDGEVTHAEFLAGRRPSAPASTAARPQVTTGQVNVGRYACGAVGALGVGGYRPDLEILPGGRYRVDGKVAPYRYDRATRTLTWAAGGLPAAWVGSYLPDKFTSPEGVMTGDTIVIRARSDVQAGNKRDLQWCKRE